MSSFEGDNDEQASAVVQQASAAYAKRTMQVFREREKTENEQRIERKSTSELPPFFVSTKWRNRRLDKRPPDTKLSAYFFDPKMKRQQCAVEDSP
jgi:hypothetical protein